MSLPFDPPQMAQRLLRWYGAKGRDLPWRQNRDPYCIWLSEIMLQQTGVVTVIPYYQRFLDKFPTLQQLAAAPLDDVIQLWAGLGYYSRARNLHKAAQQVMAEHSGVFPSQLDDIQALPGIGRSTAGAILSIAFDQPAPILDGNVRRVLVRLFAWRNDPRSSAAEKQLWQWAEQLTPPQQAHDYAQAIMDLGATVCTPRTPDCANCPLRALCVAHQQGLAETLPIKRKRAKAPLRRQVALVVMSEQGLLMRQRPVEGFLGGLWELPAQELVSELEADVAAKRLMADLALNGSLQALGSLQHVYSHFKLELSLFVVEDIEAETVAEDRGYVWRLYQSAPKQFPLHGAHLKAYALWAKSVAL